MSINTEKYNTKATYVLEIVYLKQKQVDMVSLVFKKLKLCPIMPASSGCYPTSDFTHSWTFINYMYMEVGHHHQPLFLYIQLWFILKNDLFLSEIVQSSQSS